VFFEFIYWGKISSAGYLEITAKEWIICEFYTPDGVVVVVPVIMIAAVPARPEQVVVKYLLLFTIISLQM